MARRTFSLTDSGNAEYFAARYGENLRFDHRRKRWLIWNGVRWLPDVDGEVWRLAKSAVRSRLIEAVGLGDDSHRDKAIKWALGSENRSRLEALLHLARSERPIADDGTQWDADPWLLGAPNGVIDLRSGTLRTGRREDQITMCTGVPYDPPAQCPLFVRFLEDVLAGNQDVIDFTRRAVGYSLTGLTSEQVVFFIYGPGANGKGTKLNTLRAVLGDYAWNMPFSTIELHQRSAIPNDLAALVSRRFVVASETNDGTRLNEARVKALTGCDPVTARFLHGEFFEFEPTAKYWLATNHKPVVRDDSFGFWRRIRLIPFTQTFAVDPTLADTLKQEAAGILAWAVQGCLEWQARGLEPPATVIAATEEYRADSDPLRGFLETACVSDEHATVRASELFDHYKRWADREGLSERERLSATSFGRKMTERFDRVKTSAHYLYRGVGIATLH